MSAPVTIILVDDHTVVRNGLKTLIESLGDYKVIDEFDDGKSLVNALPLKKVPDVIIMDIAMPKMDGKQTMQWFKLHGVRHPVLILTLDTSEKTIIDLFRLGVRGYISKTCTAEVLKNAIDTIAKSGYYHNEFFIKALNTDESDDGNNNVKKQVSPKEKTFLQLVCDEKEYTYEQIADIMGVHRRTVDGYRESLFEKFKIKSKTGLVLFALKYGMLDTR